MSTGVKPPRLSGHQPGLDGVRGLAILMVMALHFVGDATPHNTVQKLAVKAATYGLFGVDLFFVLSGFLITGLLLDAKGGPNYFRNFYARRTLRIFPLYYAVLAAFFLIAPLFTTLTPMLEEARSKQGWLWTYLTNFYISSKGDFVLTYFSHFWSLAIEEHFYLLWPLVVFSFRNQTLERLCVVVVVGALALRGILTAAGLSEVSVSVLTPCRVDALCAGGLAAILMRRPGNAEPMLAQSGRWSVVTGVLLVALSALCSKMGTGQAGRLVFQLRGTLLALFFVGLVLLSLKPATTALGRAFRNPALRFFGKYSYGLYVYHGILTWYFIEKQVEKRLDAALGNHALTMVAYAALGTGISLAVSVASYELFEKRFLKLKRFFEARPAPAEAPRVPSAM